MMNTVVSHESVLMNRVNTTSKHLAKPAPATGNIIGWREWVSLPELGIPAIKAKIDTGARTSAIHAFRIETFDKEGAEFVRFWIHPLRRKLDVEIVCEARIIDERNVKDSGGHIESRYFIKTPVSIGSRRWNIELTLTSRDNMMFRMLLGRTAITGGGLMVSPDQSYLAGKRLARAYRPGKKSNLDKMI